MESFALNVEVNGLIWFWKGPAPHYFVTVPEDASAQIKEIERLVTYGWGMIPARARIGETEYGTALWPKDGRYIVPIKAAVRRAEGLSEGDHVTIELTI